MYKTLEYNSICTDILNANHCLIGGATGSGKSVLLNQILYGITAYNPKYCKVIIIDLKRVDFLQWKDFPHVLRFITRPEQVHHALDELLQEMECRYAEMEAKNIVRSDKYQIYCVIDEFAQVLAIPGTLQKIVKLGQLARAAEIHLILATQDCSKKGIPAQIQQNVTCRVGLKTLDKIASKQVTGITGCESLPRYGKCIIVNGLDMYKTSVEMLHPEDIQNRLKEVNEYYK